MLIWLGSLLLFYSLHLDPAAQQVAPYLFQATKNLGGMAAAMPLMQEASRRVMEMVQGTEGATQNVDGFNDQASSSSRKYRDVRPAKKRFSFSGEEGSRSRKSSQSYLQEDKDSKRKASYSGKQRTSTSPSSNGDSAMDRIARFMGADFGSGDATAQSKQKNR